MNYANTGMSYANIGITVKEHQKVFIVFGLRLGVMSMTYANIVISNAIIGIIYSKNTMVYANDSMIFYGLTPLLAKHVGKKSIYSLRS
jgi:hypothetical protein